MLYKTLYKKNCKGSMMIWSIYHDDSSYWTEYGKLDGKLIVTKPTIVEKKNVGKINETSVKQQLISEMDSLIDFKIKKEKYAENLDDADFYDDYSPMLAQIFSEYNEDMKFVQPKLDGVRMNLYNDKALSRKGNEFKTVEHIRNELNGLFSEFPNIVLDGELYNHNLNDNFNQIVSLVRKNKLTDEEISEVTKYIEYHVYDVWFIGEPDMLYSDRLKWLYEHLSGYKYVKLVQTESVTCMLDISSWFKYFTNMGYEGAIIRKDGVYEHKRSKNLLKLKEFRDCEYEIVDVCNGKGQRSDIAGFIVLKDNETKQTFKSSIKGTFEYAKWLLEHKNEVIGKMATIKFFSLTPKIGDVGGIPRFPTMIAIRDYE